MSNATKPADEMTAVDFKILTDKIAHHLRVVTDDRWVVVEQSSEWSNDHTAKIRRGDGPDAPTLWLSNTWAGEGKLYISGNYPRQGNTAYTYPDKQDQPDGIRVSTSRDPLALAKDIAWRFIPAYLAAHAVGLAQRAEQVAAENRRHALAARLAPICGNKPSTERPSQWNGYRHGGEGGYCYGEAYSDDTCNLDLKSVPADKAEVILRILYS